MNEYQKQAKEFCEKTQTVIDVKFLYSGLHFENDKEVRDIYEIMIFRNGQNKKPYIFKFGQSVLYSRDYVEKAALQREARGESMASIYKYKKSAVKAPTEYDILAALTKYDCGTFKDFCSEFGYSDDSIAVQKTYFAVQEEWSNVNRLFNDCLEEIQEIQ